MALNLTHDQVELLDHADITLAVTHDLPLPHHCGKTAAEYFVFLWGDREKFMQRLLYDWDALLFQDLEHELPARKGVSILLFLTLKMRV